MTTTSRTERMSLLPPHPDERVKRLAYAISVAEGFWVPGSKPFRLNNPGDLMDQNGVLRQFSTPEEGWKALYRQVEKMLTGTSKHYKPTMTIAQVAKKYTATEQEAWAKNVAKVLGVDVSTEIASV